MARDKEKNLILKDTKMPSWMGDWAINNPNEAKLMWLIFAPETSVSKYFNKKYPELIDDFTQEDNDFEHLDFAEEGWESYIAMKNKDKEVQDD